jgi:NAD(P)H-flavin reductase
VTWQLHSRFTTHGSSCYSYCFFNLFPSFLLRRRRRRSSRISNILTTFRLPYDYLIQTRGIVQYFVGIVLGDTKMRKLPKLRLFCFLSVVLELSSAFTPLSLPTTTSSLSSSAPVHAFSTTSRRRAFGTRLSAEEKGGSSSGGGAAKEAPQYKKIGAVVRNVEQVGDGSFMLRMQVDDEHYNNSVKLDYKPGHVMALEIQDPSENESEMTADTIKNGGWMRGPYTISRATPSTLDVLIRVVGKKSAALANAPVNTPVRFGGKFKVPILDGVDQKETKKVIMIATGVGIGPCIGAIEMALQHQQQQQQQQQKENDDEYKNFPPIHLIATFRHDSHVVYREHLNALSKQHPTRFTWTPVITSKTGRIAASKESVQQVIADMRIHGLSLQHDVHYHLIGNGQMVQEWQTGLKKAGVHVDQRVTIENYFNTRAQPNATAIDNIASAISSSACAAVHACK